MKIMSSALAKAVIASFVTNMALLVQAYLFTRDAGLPKRDCVDLLSRGQNMQTLVRKCRKATSAG
jgi:hypothetical protein